MSTDETEQIIVPDVPQTFLAFRTWRVDPRGKLMSINPPAITGKAGGPDTPKPSWIHRQLASPTGGWPTGGQMLKAHCGRGVDPAKTGAHGKIPSKECTCGIYATTDLRVVNRYLGTGSSLQGPVLGIVEMGGHVIPADRGFRASHARIAAILGIDPAYTLSHSRLRDIAELYHCPFLIPHSIIPEEYRDRLREDTPLGDEVEEALRKLMDGSGE